MAQNRQPERLCRRLQLSTPLLVGILVSCGSTPKAPPPDLSIPGLRVALDAYWGTPLSGPRETRTAQVKRGAVVREAVAFAHVRVYALEPSSAADLVPAASQDNGFSPLGSFARRFGVEGSAEPLRTAAPLGGDTRVQFPHGVDPFRRALQDGAWGRAELLVDGPAPVRPDATTILRLDRGDPQATPGPFEILLHVPAPLQPSDETPPTGIEVAIAHTGRVRESIVEDETTGPDPFAAEESGEATVKPSSEPPKSPEPIDVAVRQVAVLDRRLSTDGAGLAVMAPSPYSDRAPSNLLVLIELVPAERVDETLGLDACLEVSKRLGALLAAALSETVAGPDGKTTPRGETVPGSDRLIQALRVASMRRSALVHLADTTQASWTLDFALVADADILGRLAMRLVEAWDPDPSPPDRAQLAWYLERHTVETLMALLEERRILPELDALLVRHAGEAGRHKSALEKRLGFSQSPEELHRGIVDENYELLEDVSPAARARAYRWLAQHGEAPEGFDPLGSSRERRAALERAASPEVEPMPDLTQPQAPEPREEP